MNGGDIIIESLDEQPFVEGRTYKVELLLEPPSPNGKHDEPPAADGEAPTSARR